MKEARDRNRVTAEGRALGEQMQLRPRETPDERHQTPLAGWHAMNDTLDELQRKAEAATPGPWHVEEDERPGMSWNRHIMNSPLTAVCFMAHSDGKDPERDEGTAAYIACASPDVMLRLIAVARAAKAAGYSNGFDAAYPDKLDRLRESLSALESAGGTLEEGTR